MSHIHILVSDKKMGKWKKNIFTQNVLCKIDKSTLIRHIKLKDRIIINALSKESFDKIKLPNSFNLDYVKAKKMSPHQINIQIRSMIKEHKNIQKIIKKNNLKLNEVPIIVHCYDKNCNYDHELANQLFRAGYTNVINYSEGILGYMGRTRYN
jgi:rhodanese-related sulfurtransferase